MTPDRWSQVDQLLAQALELSEAERPAFLAAACRNDDDLRHEVESLLNAHQEAETDFLSTLAFEAAARELADEPHTARIGTDFGPYSLLSVLGIGGMGEVYLAHDARLNRKVALKLLPAQFTQDAARVKRFEREARAVSALNHPNIVTVYDIGRHDGTHFIAMEHVEGRTLRDQLNALHPAKHGEKAVVELALQIAAALDAAHKAGIVHRDIKPENVMVRSDNFVKVVDFGLAKLSEQQATLAETLQDGYDAAATNPGTVLGTLRYMSPEQAEGREVDLRSDLFSLGIVLYELLSGSAPFKGDRPAAVLDAVVHHTPLPLRQLRPEVSADSARIIHRLLEKDCAARYQTADDLRADLKQLQRELDSSPSFASAQSDAEKAMPRSPARTTQWLNTKMAGFAVAAIAVLGFATWRFWRDAPAAPAPWFGAYSRSLTDFPGEERHVSLSPDGKGFFYARRVQGQWDIFRQHMNDGTYVNLTQDNDADDMEPVCSPNGSSVAFRSEREGGGLFVMGADGKNIRNIANFGHNPSWSPDGQQIVCGTTYIFLPKLPGTKSSLVVINLATGQQRVLVEGDDASQPQWSPGGKRIAYYRNRRDIWTIAADGSNPRAVTDDAAVDWNPVWSNDGQYLYFASDRQAAGSLWRIRIDEATGRTLGQPEPVTGPTAEVLQMDLSRDGRRIAYVTRVQDANLKSIAFDPVKLAVTGEPVVVTQGTRPSGSPSLSPDGQWVAFHSLGAPREDIWLTRASGGTPTNLTDDAPMDRSPRWSPDGKQLVFSSNRTGTWQIWLMNPDGSNKRQLTFSESGCNTPFWSPDGRRIAWTLTSSADQARQRQRGTQILEVDKPWTQQTPVTLPDMPEEGGWFNGYHWSPDGNHMVGTAAGLQGHEVRNKAGLYLFSFETNRYEKLTDFGDRPEWLADSRHVVFMHTGKGPTAEQRVWLVDTENKAPRPLITHPTWVISTLGLSRDNRRLFFTATDHQSDVSLLSLDK